MVGYNDLFKQYIDLLSSEQDKLPKLQQPKNQQEVKDLMHLMKYMLYSEQDKLPKLQQRKTRRTLSSHTYRSLSQKVLVPSGGGGP